MNKENELQLMIIDQDEQDFSSTPNSQPLTPQNIQQNTEIFVFDDDQEESGYGRRHMNKQNFMRKPKLQDSSDMSNQQFTEQCQKLEDRIIFSNLKSFKENVQKSQTTFFADAKNKRRESDIQIRNHVPTTQKERYSMYTSNVPKDIKVDFLQSRPSSHSIGTKSQISLCDEISNSSQIQGAKIGSQRSTLEVVQDNSKNILRVSDFKQFLYTQIQPKYQIFVQIKRTYNGFIDSAYKCYFLQNQRFILSCQKQGLTKYIFSSNKVHVKEDHISFLARMDANLFGSSFLLFDSGQDNSNTKFMQNYKKQLAAINYTQERGQPRSFQALISTTNNKSTDFTIMGSQENILGERWKSDNQENIARLTTRMPVFDRQQQNYKLDLKGIAGLPSTNNFIVQSQQHPQAIIFGKQDKDTYLMRVKSPFSLLQAIAIGISSIHYKFL